MSSIDMGTKVFENKFDIKQISPSMIWVIL